MKFITKNKKKHTSQRRLRAHPCRHHHNTLPFKTDSGADVTVILDVAFQEVIRLQLSNAILTVKGTFKTYLHHNGSAIEEYVVDNQKHSLLGRQAAHRLHIVDRVD